MEPTTETPAAPRQAPKCIDHGPISRPMEEVRSIGGALLGYHCPCGRNVDLSRLCATCQGVVSLTRWRKRLLTCWKCERRAKVEAAMHPCRRAGCEQKTLGLYCSRTCRHLHHGVLKAKRDRERAVVARRLQLQRLALCSGCGDVVLALAECEDCGKLFGNCGEHGPPAITNAQRAMKVHRARAHRPAIATPHEVP